MIVTKDFSQNSKKKESEGDQLQIPPENVTKMRQENRAPKLHDELKTKNC